MADEVHGKDPDKKSFWHRFARQDTGPQRLVVGVAGTVTAVATCVAGVYAVGTAVRGDESLTTSESSRSPLLEPADSTAPQVSTPSETAVPTLSPSPAVTVAPSQTLVAQGSPEADDLVRALAEADGGRVTLAVVVLAQRRDRNPQWWMRLWYNCQGLPAGEPPGEDLCDQAVLIFDDSEPDPPDYDRPRRIELEGIWADNRPTGLGYGASGLEFYLTQATF